MIHDPKNRIHRAALAGYNAAMGLEEQDFPTQGALDRWVAAVKVIRRALKPKRRPVRQAVVVGAITAAESPTARAPCTGS